MTPTIEVTVKDAIEPTIVESSFTDFVNDLNIAAASGKQYVIATELHNATPNRVAFETRSITRIREMEDLGEHAFIGR